MRKGSSPMSECTKILLEEDEMPTQWYNIVADLPEPPPPALHPGTHQPATAEDFAPLFPMALVEQEVSTERYICLLYTSPSPRDGLLSRMPSSA